MAKKKYTNKSGDTFEWEETEEMRKAIEPVSYTHLTLPTTPYV